MKVGVIGLGTMGEMLVRSLYSIRTLAGVTDIVGFDHSSEKLEFLNRNYGVLKGKDELDCASKSNVIYIAVKPKDALACLQAIAPVIRAPKIIVSIVAGLDASVITKNLSGFDRIVRLMPNTACAIGEGSVGLWFSPSLSDEDRGKLLILFQNLGRLFPADKESAMNLLTAICGSGPAFVYRFADSLIQALKNSELPPELHRPLVVQLMKGAIHLMERTDVPVDDLVQQVRTPGGTTEAGLSHLDQGNFHKLVESAIKMAEKRAAKLIAPKSDPKS